MGYIMVNLCQGLFYIVRFHSLRRTLLDRGSRPWSRRDQLHLLEVYWSSGKA